MRKRIFALLIAVVMLLICTTGVAAGDVNIDSGGGDMTEGDGGNYWNVGNDGVRVTVIEDETWNIVSASIDYSNINTSKYRCYGGENKLQLRGGGLSLSPSGGTSVQPSTPLPNIMGGSVATMKEYFSREGTIQDIASHTGMDYETLISGDYLLMLEPIAYFKWNGAFYALTATEAAIFDQQHGGALKATMGYLTHQNLPLAMFLEETEFGIPAYSGSPTGIKSNNTITSQLGVAAVRFDEKPEIIAADYEYRTDTDVITSVLVSTGKRITPDDEAVIRFTPSIGGVYEKSFVIPEGDSQLLWFGWHTPKDPMMVNVGVTTNLGSAEKGVIKCNVVELKEKTPPDPQGRDRNDGWSQSSFPDFGSVTHLSWGEWYAEWEPKWQPCDMCGGKGWLPETCTSCGGSGRIQDYDYRRCSCGGSNPSCSWCGGSGWYSDYTDMQCGTCSGKGYTEKDCENVNPNRTKVILTCENGWIDWGDWLYTWIPYEASLSVSSSLKPDDNCPTASGNTMKSGYGVNITVNGQPFSTGDCTPIQNVVTLFPEFGYKGFFRLLEGGGGSFEFKENEYSQFTSRAHFTPVWFPDRSYETYSIAFDAWTPAGMLYDSATAEVNIQGNVYDDWHIAPSWKKT